MKTKIILAGILLLLCGGSFAQRIVEYGDLRTLTDAEHGTGVYYLKDGKRPLLGEYTDGRETGHWVRYDSTNGEILNGD